MVHDSVWRDAGLKRYAGWLCIPCLEVRLRRPLTGADFRADLPINEPDRDDDTDLLACLKRSAALHRERTAPKRIQLSRAKGWRKPADAIVVSRPTRYGNPFPANGDRALAVTRFREWLEGPHNDRITADNLESLRGRDLCCWCPLDGPCHADVLLELANR